MLLYTNNHTTTRYYRLEVVVRREAKEFEVKNTVVERFKGLASTDVTEWTDNGLIIQSCDVIELASVVSLFTRMNSKSDIFINGEYAVDYIVTNL